MVSSTDNDGYFFSRSAPLIAGGYQIVVMCIIFSMAALSAAFYAVLAKNKFADRSDQIGQPIT